MIVSSLGALQSIAPPARAYPGAGSVSLYSGSMSSYAALYRTQPNVRTCVDFLARNVAQLGIHAFRRVSDTDRQRLPDHGLAQLLRRPNQYTTRYRLFEGLMQDLGIYWNAYWLKVRTGSRVSGLVRLPPEAVSVEGGIAPRAYQWSYQGRELTFAPEQIVHFAGYDPMNPLGGISPLETLRRVLAEDAAASDHRLHYWNNAARIEGVIERPKDAPPWDATQRAIFREQWQAAHAGHGNAGKTAILEDGMTLKPAAFNARDSELTAARKLAREEVAAAYHIPLPMVGILEHATFSNIREQHKHLYQDSLGPPCVMIEEEIERQLLPDFEDTDRVYFEFNIQEKLKGSFEEQSTSIRSLVGGPIMTPNEGRGRLNLPSMDDPAADALIRPLNVAPAAGEPDDDDDGNRRPGGPAAPDNDRDADGDEPDAAAFALTLRAFLARQGQAVQKLPAAERVARFARARWNAELAADLIPVYEAAGASPAAALQRASAAATAINDQTRALLSAGRPAFGTDRVIPVLS